MLIFSDSNSAETPLCGQTESRALDCSIDGRRQLLRKLAFVAALAATLVVQVSCLHAQPTGDFARPLQRTVSVTWQDQELAVAVERLARTADIVIWLDRRVDPRQSVTLELADTSLASALETIAAEHAIGLAQLGSVGYLGPVPTARGLPTLSSNAHQQLASAPRRLRQKWLIAKSVQWPRLTEPRSLVQSWLQAAGIRLVGDERIPHDLLPRRQLPPMALVDRLVLLLAGFDLTCAINPDGKSCEIVPITSSLSTSHAGEGQQRPVAQRPTVRKPVDLSRQRFTLRLKNQPLGRVLDQLAAQLALEVAWHVADVEQTQQQLVSCEVQQVGFASMLENVLLSTDLEHQLEGTRLTIRQRH